jgi:hypothetical protein
LIPRRSTYFVSASGDNMWGAEDDFQFVWKKMSGDVALSADIVFAAKGGNAHRKAVLMIRQSLDGDSAYVDAAVHGDGLTSLQSRDAKGAATREVGVNDALPRHIRLEKRGLYFCDLRRPAWGRDAAPRNAKLPVLLAWLVARRCDIGLLR